MAPYTAVTYLLKHGSKMGCEGVSIHTQCFKGWQFSEDSGQSCQGVVGDIEDLQGMHGSHACREVFEATL